MKIIFLYTSINHQLGKRLADQYRCSFFDAACRPYSAMVSLFGPLDNYQIPNHESQDTLGGLSRLQVALKLQSLIEEIIPDWQARRELDILRRHWNDGCPTVVAGIDSFESFDALCKAAGDASEVFVAIQPGILSNPSWLYGVSGDYECSEINPGKQAINIAELAGLAAR